jgi:flagellar assembly protein FliH
MDAEIRRLTYVPRHEGSRVWNGIPDTVHFISGQPSAFNKNETVSHTSRLPDVRLEARVIELESERSELQKIHREEMAAAHQAAAEGMAAALREQKEMLGRTLSAEITAALASFREEQKRYFREAESAVVRLALGIAARVLHREAQLDPLLLRGPVRVALEDAHQGTACVLEVAEREVEKWRQWLSLDPTLAGVEVRGRDDVQADHCHMEIGASMADLSVHAQLAEIERGFFDLLQSRSIATPLDEQKQ